MSYAPTEFYPITKGGCFREEEFEKVFEYNFHNEDKFSEFPHRVFVNSNPAYGDGTWRYALVKKTVAYIVIDEDEYGKPVIQKWQIKNHDKYGEQ
jgi:hypothetical protein|tara:strand:- start:378 stop:662 length:285 start_codon:yes stop_codon:yes gene_type:complete